MATLYVKSQGDFEDLFDDANVGDVIIFGFKEEFMANLSFSSKDLCPCIDNLTEKDATLNTDLGIFTRGGDSFTWFTSEHKKGGGARLGKHGSDSWGSCQMGLVLLYEGKYKLIVIK